MFVNNRGYSKLSVGVGTVYREFSSWVLECSCLVQKQAFRQNSSSYFRKLVTLAVTHKDEGSLGHVKCFRGRPVEGDAYCLHNVPCHASTDALRFSTALKRTLIQYTVARKTTGLSCVRMRRVCILVCLCKLFS